MIHDEATTWCAGWVRVTRGCGLGSDAAREKERGSGERAGDAGTLKIAVLQGDPMTAGHSYTLRLSCTDGTKIAPHWHPATENVTVIKGTFLLGMGAKWDDAAMKEIPVGGFASAPPEMRHYAQCKGDGVVQVNGIAPFLVNFVGPDDPGPAKKTN
jgi:quercetin dioxygenase-like cupin family protein